MAIQIDEWVYWIIGFILLGIILFGILPALRGGNPILDKGNDLVDGAISDATQSPSGNPSELPSNIQITSAPAPNVPLTGTIAEKAVRAAKEAGMDKAGAELVLKLISKESSFRHCCQEAGKTLAHSCVGTDVVECSPDKIISSGDGTSTGVMQLNKDVHKPWFTTSESSLCSDPKYTVVCAIKQNAGCMGKTAYNMDCNIKMGVRLLIAYHNQYKGGKKFECAAAGSPTYTGWDAALRAYVGWGCDTFHAKYVSQVNEQDISQYAAALSSIYG